MVNWITDTLGTASFRDSRNLLNSKIVDVRAMVDRGGNSNESILAYIQQACNYLSNGSSVVICCDHGISRSNSIAAGVICKEENCNFATALQKVLDNTKIGGIRPEVLVAVKNAIGETTCEKSSGSNWLVTGGTGNLGSLFASNTSHDHMPLVPTKNSLDLLDGGVAMYQFLENSNIDKVIHFADQHITNTNDYLGNSLTMLKNVLDACAINHTPLIIMSRWEVFAGLTNNDVEVVENTRRCPAGVLGETKCLFEDLALRFLENQRVPVTIVRSGLVYDKNYMPNFMRYILRAGKAGNQIHIHNYNNGFSAVDVIHAMDWKIGMHNIIQSNEVGVFHLGGELMFLDNLAKEACKLGGGESQITPIKIQGDTAKIKLKARRKIPNADTGKSYSWKNFVTSLR